MLQLKPLSRVSLEEALSAWNEGFAGYYTDVTLTLERFVERMSNEDLSPRLSLVAYVDGKPAGLIMNGIRMVGNQKVAWNGGTAIAPDYRGKGIGKELVKASLELYRKEKVDIATLEAIQQNTPAIRLYQNLGYEVVDELHFLQCEGPVQDSFFPVQEGLPFFIHPGLPHQVKHLSFYNHNAPWQTQWQSLRKDGESWVISDGREPVGYLLFKKVYDSGNGLKSILLYQAEVNPQREDGKEIIRYGLKNLFLSMDVPVQITTVNLCRSNTLVYQVLQEAGFVSKLQQVYMIQRLNSDGACN